MVGLDAGVTKLAMRPDGTVFEIVNCFQKSQKELAKIQRQLSRKVKFSNNWQKQKDKIQRLHSRIVNIRRDSLHKVTTAISKNHAMIVIGKNMSRSAAGTSSPPGHNVRAKSCLNRSYTSQRYTCCGHIAQENHLSQSKFKCLVCGYRVNAKRHS